MFTAATLKVVPFEMCFLVLSSTGANGSENFTASVLMVQE
jgi:hypothetical protein